MHSRGPADTPHYEPAHTEKGLKKLLAVPVVYRLFGRALGGTRAATRFVREYVKPFPGCRILDLGCGPGDLPIHLPDTIGEYLGVDMNPAYVEAARAQWKGHQTLSFTCADLSGMAAPHRDYYDIVVALGVVHHLDDASARRMFAIAYDALAPCGRLVTYDQVYITRQNAIARWLISHDRGQAVRTADLYRQLANGPFTHVSDAVLHDTLRVPYTIFVMTCTKTIP